MICNTGIGLIPTIDGKVELFREQGLYDGLFLMADEGTGTYWNHMTGEAVHGPLAGSRLEVENVLHTTVDAALAANPGTQVAWSTHESALERSERGGTLSGLLDRIRGLPRIFPATLGAEDDRRDRMDIGIGVWNDARARYYAMEAVQAAGNAVLDDLDGHTVLVYYDPAAYALAAHYTEADRVWWEDDVLHLSTGEYIEEGVRHAADGTRVEGLERPLQVYTRWYGFSLTFPDTEVWEEGR